MGGRTRTATTSRPQQARPGGPAPEQVRRDEGDQHRQHGQHGQGPEAGAPVHGRGGQLRAVPGDRDDPGHAEGRQGPDERPRRRPGHADQPAGQSQDRGRTDRGRRRQVGDHGHDADLARDRGDQRGAGQLGGRRDRDRLGEPPGQPPLQGVTPSGREQQDAGGRGHRQREADAHGQQRVEQEQRHHGGAQRTGTATPAVGAHREEGDGPHRGGTHDAGLGAGQEHEPDDAQRTDEVHPPAADPAPARQDQQEPDDQGEVGPRHREQVGQPGLAEVVGEVRVETRVVAVHQGRDQRPLAGGSVRDRVAEGLAYGARAAPPHTGPAEQLGGSVDGHDGRDSLTVRRREPPERCAAGSPARPRPSRRRRGPPRGCRGHAPARARRPG